MVYFENVIRRIVGNVGPINLAKIFNFDCDWFRVDAILFSPTHGVRNTRFNNKITICENFVIKFLKVLSIYLGK